MFHSKSTFKDCLLGLILILVMGFNAHNLQAQSLTLTGLEDIEVANDQGVCGATIAIPVPGVENATGDVTITNDFTSDSAALFPVGTTQVIFTATDSQASVSDTINVTVVDTELPTLATTNNIFIPSDLPLPLFYPADAVDNCPDASAVLTQGLGTGAEFPFGVSLESYEVTDAAGNVNTVEFNVAILPTTISEFPYCESFEFGDGSWFASGVSGTANSWELGEPAGEVISGASNGLNAWATGLSSPYSDEEESAVFSPEFNFVGLEGDAPLRFTADVFFELESFFDGVTLQSSTDLGQTWQTVGENELNFYNGIVFTEVSEETGADFLPAWTGTVVEGIGSGEYVTVSADISNLKGAASVLFRFLINSSESFEGENPFDGFAFDNIRIAEDVTFNQPVVAEFPYCESFETGDGNWITAPVCGTANSWELGEPAGEVISGASDGITAWATGLSSAYADNEESAVYSPIFDFSNLQDPRFVVDVWYESEFSQDGVTLQASTDGGITFANVGELELNFYNGIVFSLANGTEFLPAWTGASVEGLGSGGYVTLAASVAEFAGEGSVIFRFLFNAGEALIAANELDGFAFDNVRIEENILKDRPVVAQFPYSESFEEGDGNWLAAPVCGTANSWELGTPAGTVIMGASNGVSAWATGLSTPYADSEQSAVYSPAFDFSNLNDPRFSIDVWYESEFSQDGVTLQASTDGGVTYSNVGELELDFYNGIVFSLANGTEFLPAWTGASVEGLGSGGYVTVAASVAEFAGESNVIFRVLFNAGEALIAANDLDGFAFDNVRIFEDLGERPVVAEFPYCESFEFGDGGWISVPVSGSANSWELGEPAGEVISGASDGLIAWATGLSSPYADEEESAVISPSFDFSNLQDPRFVVDVWYESEFAQDGVTLQASTDGGVSFVNVGELELNFYNGVVFTEVSEQTGADFLPAWTGASVEGLGSNGYITLAASVAEFAGEGSVIFRFLLNSSEAFLGANELDGFAFDNVRIEENILQDRPVVAQFPYQEGFENGDGNWIAASVCGTANSWELGTPAGTVIMGASEGENAWATGLATPYADNEESAVYSPAFDFSNVTEPVFTVDVWFESEFSQDGVTLQATTDGGITYTTIGELELDFYNGIVFSLANGTEFLPAWTGASVEGLGSGGYITVDALMPELAGESNVIFRFLLNAGEALILPNDLDGFAFDNVRIADAAVAPIAVTDFVLIDASTDTEIAPITDGSVFNTNVIGNELNILANTDPAKVGRVVFELTGPVSINATEQFAPYALAGNVGTDFNAVDLVPGMYTLTATPIAQGLAGAPLTVNFEITEGAPIAVTDFVLIDADTDVEVGPLANGDVVDLASIGIIANTDPAQVGSVVFELNGEQLRIENFAPYAVGGDDREGDFFGINLEAGQYTLVATPFTDANGQGEAGASLSVEFAVGVAAVVVFPNPSTGSVNLMGQPGSAVQIYTEQGHLVFEGAITNGLINTNLQPGRYIIKSKDGETQRLIVE